MSYAIEQDVMLAIRQLDVCDYNLVMLTALRAKLPYYDKAKLDAALLSLRKQNIVSLGHIDGLKTEADWAASVDGCMTVSIRRPF